MVQIRIMVLQHLEADHRRQVLGLQEHLLEMTDGSFFE